MKKLLSIIFLVSLVSLAVHDLNGREIVDYRCNLVFDHKVDDTSNGKDNGQISLSLIEGEAPFKIHLLSISESGKLIQTKEFKAFRKGVFQVVFKNLKPGEYLIRIDNDLCKMSLTGLESIQIR